ncbi:hypothetical protein Tco_1565946, partial [Tanacetum coccineum]
DNEITDPNVSDDPRLLLRLDLVPRRVVHRELPDDLPEEVTPMSRVVTERHQPAFIAELKPDLLRAPLIRILTLATGEYLMWRGTIITVTVTAMTPCYISVKSILGNMSPGKDTRETLPPSFLIDKLIIDGKVILVDDDGKQLKKIDYPGDHDSEDEVESVDNDMARSMASERVGFGTQSLLEQ